MKQQPEERKGWSPDRLEMAQAAQAEGFISRSGRGD